MICKMDLLRVKTRALRMNIWYQTLSKPERAIIDLTVKCVERVKSHVLTATIARILKKILEALECGFLLIVEKTGRKVAEQVCEIAQKWGNKQASKWKFDSNFVKFLGISAVNSNQYRETNT